MDNKRPYGYGGGEDLEASLANPTDEMVRLAVGSRGLRTLIAGKVISGRTRDEAIRDLLSAAWTADREAT